MSNEEGGMQNVEVRKVEVGLEELNNSFIELNKTIKEALEN